jgi:hypothetical protein
MPEKKRKGTHWGAGIVTLYAGFVVFILVIVGFASMQRFDLVDSDYYARGLDYEKQLQRINRVRALPERPIFEVRAANSEVILHFPRTFDRTEVSGTLTLFRPSAAGLDMSVSLALDSSYAQHIVSPRLVAGLWRAKLSWSVRGVEYYDDQEITLE